MGLFDFVDDIFIDPFELFTAGAIDGGEVFDLFKSGEEVPGVSAPTEDQKTKYLRELQRKVADKYKADMGDTIAQGKGLINAQGQEELDNENRGIDRQANQRGLFYSGKRQANRAAAAADVAGRVGKSVGDFEVGVRDQARALEGDAIDGDIESSLYNADIMGVNQDSYVNNLNRALKQKQQKRANYDDFASGMNKAGGTYMSSRNGDA